MALESLSKCTLDHPPVSLPEIVFSCGVCQALVSEVYEILEHDQGFRSASDDGGDIITKFWIADCSHIFCGKHLDGGAAPFHPLNTAPRAQCPMCIRKGVTTVRNLFGIRGLAPGQYETAIPDSYMQFPPAVLNAQDPNMDALRFQYGHVVRYAQEVTKSWRLAREQCRILESLHKEEQKHHRRLQSETQQLRNRLAVLENAEVKLQKWERRKPVIHHYLASVDEMARDIKQMRLQLGQFGVDVPYRNYSFEAVHGPQSHQRDVLQATQDTLMSDQHDSSSLSRKRKQSEVPLHTSDQEIGSRHLRRSSGEIMPPPSSKVKPSQPSHSNSLPLSQLEGLAQIQLTSSMQLITPADEDFMSENKVNSFLYTAEEPQFARTSPDVPPQPSQQATLPYQPSHRLDTTTVPARPWDKVHTPDHHAQLSHMGRRPNHGFLSLPARRRSQRRVANGSSQTTYPLEVAFDGFHHDPQRILRSSQQLPQTVQDVNGSQSKLLGLTTTAGQDVASNSTTTAVNRPFDPPLALIASPFFQNSSSAVGSQLQSRREHMVSHQFQSSSGSGPNRYQIDSSRHLYSVPPTWHVPTSFQRCPPEMVNMEDVSRTLRSQTQRPLHSSKMQTSRSQRPPVQFSNANYRASAPVPRSRISFAPSGMAISRGTTENVISSRIFGVRGIDVSCPQSSRQSMLPMHGSISRSNLLPRSRRVVR